MSKKTYRMLEVGEIRQTGDEYFDVLFGWKPTKLAGTPVTPFWVGKSRRPIKEVINSIPKKV